MNKSDWYVLMVAEHREIKVLKTLCENGYSARVPREICTERKGGKEKNIERVIIPGYVFVKIEVIDTINTAGVLKVARERCSSARFIGQIAPLPITKDEAVYIGLLAPSENAIESSVIQFDEFGTPRVVSGILENLKDNIVTIKKRQHRAFVKIPFNGAFKTIRLGVEVQDG